MSVFIPIYGAPTYDPIITSKEKKMDSVNQLSSEDKYKLAESMAVPTKNCRAWDYPGIEKNQPEIIVKSRTAGACTNTSGEQIKMISKLMSKKNDTTESTSEQLQAKKEALHQEKMRRRRMRKSIKNKALTVAKSKYDRRRIARGATAEQISNKKVNVSYTRARTIRREAARNMEKLSKKFSTKRIESVPAEEAERVLIVDDCQTVAKE